MSPPAGSGSGKQQKKKPTEPGGWCGSTVQEGDITSWRAMRLLPPEKEVTVRLVDEKEWVPAPRAGERVVFGAHLERGLGLSASDFLLEFLAFFGLRLRHLGANAFILLSYFVSFCESFLGVKPTMDIFLKFFFPRTGPETEAGALDLAAVIRAKSRRNGTSPLGMADLHEFLKSLKNT